MKRLRTYLGRVIRDITRKIEGDGWLEEMVFGRILALAGRVRDQTQRQRRPKVYLLHAPEVECIGKGKAHRPYEFGVKVSVATTLEQANGGQFVIHVKSLPGNPTTAIRLKPLFRTWKRSSATSSSAPRRQGLSRPQCPPDYKFMVFTSGQKRRMPPQIKRELRQPRIKCAPCVVIVGFRGTTRLGLSRRR